ncbi:MAG: MFS transporter, partial [Bacillota bacterium]
FLASFGSYALGLLLPTLTKEFNFGLGVSGTLSSITFFVKVLIYIPLALLAARVKPKLVLGCAFAVMGLSLIIQGVATSTIMLYVGRAIMAFGSAGIIAPLALVITNWVPKPRIAQINGWQNFVVTFGQLVGSAGVVYLIAMLGSWRNMLVTLGAVGIALSVIWFFVYKENEAAGAIKLPGKQPFFEPLKRALKQKAVWLLLLGWPVTTLAWTAFSTFYPTYAVENLNISLTQAGWLIGIMAIAAAIACITSPKIAHWIGVDKLVIWPCGFILPVMFFLVLKVSSFPLLAVLFFILGYVAYAFVPVATTVIFKIPGIDAGAISASVSIIQTTTALGAAIAGIIISTLGTTSIGLYGALVVCGLSTIIFGILTLFLPEYGRKAMEKAKAEELGGQAV